LLVDEGKQQAATGSSEEYLEQNNAKIASASVDNAYPGVNLKRKVVLTDRYFIDLVNASSQSSHTYDLVYNNYENLEPDQPKNALSPTMTAPGYNFINNQSVFTPRPGKIFFQNTGSGNEDGLQIIPLTPNDSKLIYGTAPGNPQDKTHSLLINRTQGANAEFVSVVESVSGTRQIESASFENNIVKITSKDGRVDQFNVAKNELTSDYPATSTTEPPTEPTQPAPISFFKNPIELVATGRNLWISLGIAAILSGLFIWWIFRRKSK